MKEEDFEPEVLSRLRAFGAKRNILVLGDEWLGRVLLEAALEHPELRPRRKRGRPPKAKVIAPAMGLLAPAVTMTADAAADGFKLLSEFEAIRDFMVSQGMERRKVSDRYIAELYASIRESKHESVASLQAKVSRARKLRRTQSVAR